MARVGGCVAEMRRSTTKVVSDAQGAPWKLDWRCESSRLRSMDSHAAALVDCRRDRYWTYGELSVVSTQPTAATTAHVLLSKLVGLWSQVDHG